MFKYFYFSNIYKNFLFILFLMLVIKIYIVIRIVFFVSCVWQKRDNNTLPAPDKELGDGKGWKSDPIQLKIRSDQQKRKVSRVIRLKTNTKQGHLEWPKICLLNSTYLNIKLQDFKVSFPSFFRYIPKQPQSEK